MKFMLLLYKKCRLYWVDTAGVNALVFAFVLPALLAAGGLAVDLANAYNVKNRLANALDKTALATANSVGDEEELKEIARNFFRANFREDALGRAADPVITFGDKTVSVQAQATVDLLFMDVFGKDTMTVSAISEVTRELSGIEVVLVLDVTGSMAGTNIAALKSASTDFLDIMFTRIAQPELIKVGIVPYSSTVNVGPYGLGEGADGSYYGPSFVSRPYNDDYYNNPQDIEYNPSDDTAWHGCVLAEDYPYDTLDNTPDGFGMYRFPRICTASYWGYCYRYTTPNLNCPRTPIVPLTNNQNELQDAIDDLYAEGSTYGNFGMVWGWRVISPEAPFTEGEEYNSADWRKAVIMMTDGVNTMHNTYSAYGKTNRHNIRADDLDDRLADVCENMKEEDILVYTITFQSGVDENTKDIYRKCATVESMYTHAPSDDDLEEIFKKIANQLSRLHLSK